MKSNKNFPTAVRGVIGLFVNQTSEHPCDLSIVKREHFRTGIVEIDNSETAKLVREGGELFLIYDRTKARLLINEKGFIYLQIK